MDETIYCIHTIDFRERCGSCEHEAGLAGDPLCVRYVRVAVLPEAACPFHNPDDSIFRRGAGRSGERMVEMSKPIMVEIQDADEKGNTMWLVSWGGPNPEEEDCAEVASAEDALKIITRWPVGK